MPQIIQAKNGYRIFVDDAVRRILSDIRWATDQGVQHPNYAGLTPNISKLWKNLIGRRATSLAMTAPRFQAPGSL